MVVGIITLTFGVMILAGVPVLSEVGSIGGGLCVGAGALSMLVGMCLKQIKTRARQEPLPGPSSEVKVHTVPNEDHTAYSLEAVIERIVKARAEGFHTALFVGRRNDQSVPSEEGWVWFTLDKLMNKEEECRHHLQIDLNVLPIMQKIYCLFDKVVVDLGVIKAFHGSPWDNLHPLLFKHEVSQLIVESDRGERRVGPSLEINGRLATVIVPVAERVKHLLAGEQAFNAWKNTVGEERVNSEYTLFLQQLSEEEVKQLKALGGGTDSELQLSFRHFIMKREGLESKRHDYKPELLNAIYDYLFGLFHQVELKNGPYPYLNLEEPEEYWVASHPR